MRPLIAVAVVLSACGKAAVVDPAIVETTNGVSIRRDLIRVAAPKPEANPMTGTATPDALDAVVVLRYRVDTAGGPPQPARAVVVLMPGFLGGAGGFDALARAVVRRSTPDAPLEAWAIDRRANLLEDHAGIDAAADAGNPDVLTSYYFEPGSTFGGFRSQDDLAYASEWGMASTMADLRAVIAQVPAAERKARVILAGHSLGGTLVAQYAAWDFEGSAGHDELAGLVMIDSVTGREGEPIAVTRDEYETTGVMSPSMGAPVSLASVRGSARYVALPLLEASLYPLGAGAALRAMLRPDLLERDVPRAEALKLLFGLSTLPRFTNRAAFGLVFDAASCPVSIAAVNGGAAEGGELTLGPAVFGGGMLLKPTQVDATYRWREYDQVSPAEATSLDDLALAWARPGSDFGEWYFPARLSLDARLGESLTLSATDWPVQYGVRSFHGRALSLPVLVEAAGILSGNGS
ncbi:MAG: hypothetical protein JNK82_31370, partial [Myxococcaceae bacterium]|nr:hypothetical protein [Myxococcaceae bacterium]